MENLRKPFQGVKNIVRFNWHFYLIISLIILAVGCSYFFSNESLQTFLIFLIILILIPLFISLAVSYYVYDATNFYSLKWIDIKNEENSFKILNINAGFDETSDLMKNNFLNSDIQSVDFYDEKKHTEISIKRARKLYPNSPKTITVKTNFLPFENSSVDYIFLIFAAHEIRDEEERIIFFKELNRILKADGKIIVTEHLRDFNNFLAFNIGFLHFLSLKSWHKTFSNSDFQIQTSSKINPFVTTFYLTKHGTST